MIWWLGDSETVICLEKDPTLSNCKKQFYGELNFTSQSKWNFKNFSEIRPVSLMDIFEKTNVFVLIEMGFFKARWVLPKSRIIRQDFSSFCLRYQQLIFLQEIVLWKQLQVLLRSVPNVHSTLDQKLESLRVTDGSWVFTLRMFSRAINNCKMSQHKMLIIQKPFREKCSRIFKSFEKLPKNFLY